MSIACLRQVLRSLTLLLDFVQVSNPFVLKAENVLRCFLRITLSEISSLEVAWHGCFRVIEAITAQL